MRIVFTGPHAEGVTIAATGQHALPGVPLEVDDDVAERLLDQDVWVTAADKPAPKRNRRDATPGITEPAGDGQED